MIDDNLACLLDDSEEESQDHEVEKNEKENWSSDTSINHQVDRPKIRNERNTKKGCTPTSALTSTSLFNWSHIPKVGNLTNLIQNESYEKNYDTSSKDRENRNKIYSSVVRPKEKSVDSFMLRSENRGKNLNELVGLSNVSKGKTNQEADTSKLVNNSKWNNERDEKSQYTSEKNIDYRSPHVPTNYGRIIENSNNPCVKGSKRTWGSEVHNTRCSGTYDHHEMGHPQKRPRDEQIKDTCEKNKAYAELGSRKKKTADNASLPIYTSLLHENDLPEYKKRNITHQNKNRNEASWNRINFTSESDMLYKKLEAQASTEKDTLHEMRLNNTNMHMDVSENKKELQNSQKKTYIDLNNNRWREPIIEKKTMHSFEKSTAGNKNTLERNIMSREKQGKGFYGRTRGETSDDKFNMEQGVSRRNEHTDNSRKKKHLRESSNKSNILTDLVGPAGLRQKLKSFNTSEAEKKKELIYYFSFIKYKSWIRALQILGFPLDNFHLSINTYKYLLPCDTTVDNRDEHNGSSTHDVNGSNRNEELFLYRNNIHNILNNNKISNYRIDRMLVLVKSVLSRHNGYFLVVMDPSGQMPATLHKEIEKEHKKNIEVGSTLFLRNVTIFQTIDNFPYLIITLRSLVRVIKAESTEYALKERIFSRLEL